MSWYERICKILYEEPETRLAYLYGQKLPELRHHRQRRVIVRGLFRIPFFFAFILRHLRVRDRTDDCRSDGYFFFGGTLNQIKALNPTIDALARKNEPVLAIARRNFTKKVHCDSRYRPLTFSIADLFKSIILLVKRRRELLRQLSYCHPYASQKYFDRFCSSYAYLVYFLRVLEKTRPRFVITANDHNASNRCLLAVARSLGIKTAYLQHASVSEFFPALTTDYAFLDGRHAFNVYSKCRADGPNKNHPGCPTTVFLTGQKKLITKNGNLSRRQVGLALNSLDDPKYVTELSREIVRRGCQLFIRWHPGQKNWQSLDGVGSLMKLTNITFSNPLEEDVSHFLGSISVLISGNSSILLEAGLAGVVPIYYEIVPQEYTDYYGFVKNGVALQANSLRDLLELLRNEECLERPSQQSLQHYSATFGSEWEGKEGELVAECLSCLAKNAPTPLPGESLNAISTFDSRKVSGNLLTTHNPKG